MICFVELYYDDPVAPSPEQLAASRFGDDSKEDINNNTGAAQAGRQHSNGDEDDDEDDEIVFTSHSHISNSRNSSSSFTTSHVDPFAPTPAKSMRTHTKYQASATKTPTRATTSRHVTPKKSAQKQSNVANRLRSPSYDFGSQAGLLDD